MKKLLLTLALCLATLTPVQSAGVLFLAGPAPSASYVGPGDIVSGALMWFGARAYSAAYAASLGNAFDLVDQAGSNPITITVLANGNLDVATINTWVTAHSVTTIKIAKAYDQSGSGNHASQGTLASMPSLILSGVGLGTGLATMHSSGSQFLTGTFAGTSHAQPFTFTGVANNTIVSNLSSGIISTGVTTTGTRLMNGPPTLPVSGVSAGPSPGTATMTFNAWHSQIGVINAGSSIITIDGTDNSVSTGTNTIASTDVYNVMKENFGNGWTGHVAEAGLWPLSISARSALNLNQKTYWGY